MHLAIAIVSDTLPPRLFTLPKEGVSRDPLDRLHQQLTQPDVSDARSLVLGALYVSVPSERLDIHL